MSEELTDGELAIPVESVALVVQAGNKKTAPRILAKKLGELIEAGATPEAAALELGLPPRALKNASLAEEFKKLIANATFSADAQRAIVRAARIELLGKGLKAGLEGAKIALEATKQIASDPQVGLTAPPQTTINLTFAKSGELMDKMDPLPGFEDVEFDDEKEK